MPPRLAFAALAALTQLACTDGAPPSPAPERPPLRAQPLPKPGVSGARREVRAPIVRVSLRVAESFPPQYFVDITSALPNGCAQFARAEVRREGATIFVDVFNSEPASDAVACTMIYGEKESAHALGSDFTPGATYTVDANGTLERFVAQ
jgi:hypothetical protein